MILVFLSLLMLVVSAEQETVDLLKPGMCRGLWRPEKLVGKCFGLKPHHKVPEARDLAIDSAASCRSLCCNLGNACVSWQFEQPTGICRVGGIIRLGFEKTGTPDWCDPFPPALWKGRRIMSRVNSNDKGIDSYDSNKCEWEEQELTYQCFGLGDERFSVVNKSRIATAEECQQACCGDESCGIWQHSPDRGCYYNKKSNQCMKSNNNYIGGRKCLNDFCSGLENTILPNYYKSLASRNITNNM